MFDDNKLAQEFGVRLVDAWAIDQLICARLEEALDYDFFLTSRKIEAKLLKFLVENPGDYEVINALAPTEFVTKLRQLASGAN